MAEVADSRLAILNTGAANQLFNGVYEWRRPQNGFMQANSNEERIRITSIHASSLGNWYYRINDNNRFIRLNEKNVFHTALPDTLSVQEPREADVDVHQTSFVNGKYAWQYNLDNENQVYSIQFRSDGQPVFENADGTLFDPQSFGPRQDQYHLDLPHTDGEEDPLITIQLPNSQWAKSKSTISSKSYDSSTKEDGIGRNMNEDVYSDVYTYMVVMNRSGPLPKEEADLPLWDQDHRFGDQLYDRGGGSFSPRPEYVNMGVLGGQNGARAYRLPGMYDGQHDNWWNVWNEWETDSSGWMNGRVALFSNDGLGDFNTRTDDNVEELADSGSYIEALAKLTRPNASNTNVLFPTDSPGWSRELVAENILMRYCMCQPIFNDFPTNTLKCAVAYGGVGENFGPAYVQYRASQLENCTIFCVQLHAQFEHGLVSPVAGGSGLARRFQYNTTRSNFPAYRGNSEPVSATSEGAPFTRVLSENVASTNVNPGVVSTVTGDVEFYFSESGNFARVVYSGDVPLATMQGNRSQVKLGRGSDNLQVSITSPGDPLDLTVDGQNRVQTGSVSTQVNAYAFGVLSVAEDHADDPRVPWVRFLLRAWDGGTQNASKVTDEVLVDDLALNPEGKTVIGLDQINQVGPLALQPNDDTFWEVVMERRDTQNSELGQSTEKAVNIEEFFWWFGEDGNSTIEWGNPPPFGDGPQEYVHDWKSGPIGGKDWGIVEIPKGDYTNMTTYEESMAYALREFYAQKYGGQSVLDGNGDELYYVDLIEMRSRGLAFPWEGDGGPDGSGSGGGDFFVESNSKSGERNKMPLTRTSPRFLGDLSTSSTQVNEFIPVATVTTLESMYGADQSTWPVWWKPLTWDVHIYLMTRRSVSSIYPVIVKTVNTGSNNEFVFSDDTGWFSEADRVPQSRAWNLSLPSAHIFSEEGSGAEHSTQFLENRVAEFQQFPSLAPTKSKFEASRFAHGATRRLRLALPGIDDFHFFRPTFHMPDPEDSTKTNSGILRVGDQDSHLTTGAKRRFPGDGEEMFQRVLTAQPVTDQSADRSSLTNLKTYPPYNVWYSFYPAQFNANMFMYLRGNFMGENVEAKYFRGETGETGRDDEVEDSDILAVIPAEANEIQWSNLDASPGVANTGYFTYSTRKKIDSVRLHVTDAKGRVLSKGIRDETGQVEQNPELTVILRFDLIRNPAFAQPNVIGAGTQKPTQPPEAVMNRGKQPC